LDYVAVISLVLLVEIPVFWFTAQRRQPLVELRGVLNQMGFLKFTGWYALLTLCIHPLVFFGFLASGKPYLWSVLFGQIFSVVAKAWLASWSVRLKLKDCLLAFTTSGVGAWQLTPVLIYLLYYVL
jgi:hypothetical protein